MSYPSVRYGEATQKVPDSRAAQQVNELLTECSGSRIANPDRTLVEAPVQLRDGTLIGLHINLPRGFPDVAPVLTVNRPISHPYVDANRRVTLSALNHWHPGLRLKDLVRNVQSIFAGDSQRHQGTSGLSQGAPGIADTLSALSNEDLSSCLLNPEAFQKLAAGIVRRLLNSQNSDELRHRIKETAKQNLSREMEINELVNQIAIIKSTEFADARRDFEEKVIKQKEISGRISVPALIESMHKSAREVDEESDTLQGKFMDGDVGVEEFCKEYCALRVKYYTKELKAQAATHK